MAYELHLDNHVFSGIFAATTINPRSAVRIAGTTVPLAIPVASSLDVVDGVTGAGTTASGAQTVVYFDGNVVKMKAGASLGAGQDVAVGSSNGVVWGGAASIFAASLHWIVGKSLAPAATGEIVSVFVKTRRAV